MMVKEKGEKEMCPRKPPKPCSYPNCPELTYGRYCEKHQNQVEQKYSRTNRLFKHLYNTSRWKKLRKQLLQEYPLCVECKAKGVVTAAEGRVAPFVWENA